MNDDYMNVIVCTGFWLLYFVWTMFYAKRWRSAAWRTVIYILFMAAAMMIVTLNPEVWFFGMAAWYVIGWDISELRTAERIRKETELWKLAFESVLNNKEKRE